MPQLLSTRGDYSTVIDSAAVTIRRRRIRSIGAGYDSQGAGYDSGMMTQRSPQFYAVVSIVAAILTIVLKSAAYVVTGSVGLFSDAAESLVNLLAAVVAFWALTLAARPPDEEHTFGHSKAEYFASGLEGALILLAAGSIGYTAWQRVLNPQPIDNTTLGLVISIVAALLNGGVALLLLAASRQLRSVTLRANAHHLLTDVWTTGGVILGVALVQLTGWLILDPLIAIVVAANIIWTGVRLLRETGYGLLDSALPPAEQQVILDILARYQQRGMLFHALRTRSAGLRRFVSLHVLVPGDWTVQHGHDLCDEIELAISAALPDTMVITHLEPLEDPVAFADRGLDRSQPTLARSASRDR
jgi:cation diffusion facilitator family transporter